MNKMVKKIIEETGSTNVKNIELKEGIWLVTYNDPNDKPDEFHRFFDLISFLENGF